jgi:predicted RecA/RadA family phage recombinase
MKNFVKKGEVIDFLNNTGAAIASGDFVIIGSLAGFAQTNIAIGEVGAVLLKGVFTAAKAAGAITVGAKLYWVTADKNLSTTASGNTLVGVAHAAALTGDATVALQLTNGI